MHDWRYTLPAITGLVLVPLLMISNSSVSSIGRKELNTESTSANTDCVGLFIVHLGREEKMAVLPAEQNVTTISQV